MKTTKELVDDALVGVRKFLTNTQPNEPEDWEDPPKLRYYGHNPEDWGGVTRLRLDWELTNIDDTSVHDNATIARLITEALKGDLIDLIENGDMNQTNDVLLKAMNGSKKLGKTPVSVSIEELICYREHKEKKKSYEYTLFLLLRVDWSL